MRTLLLCVIALHIAHAQADPGESIDGATRKEAEIRWIWKYLGEFVRSCAEAAQECAKPEVEPVISELLKMLPLNPDSVTSTRGQRLKFISEAAHPELFKTAESEAHRLAVTGLTADADILINTDRMEIEAIKWVGYLTHEAVHHLGISEDERRLPDIVAAAVESHVAKYWIDDTLAEFNHPHEGILSFSAPAMNRPVRMLQALFRKAESDTDLGPNARVPICATGDVFQGQSIEPLFWRVTNVRGDQGYAHIRGSAGVRNICVKASGEKYEVRTSFVLNSELRFWERFDNRSAWWEKRWIHHAASITGGNYDGEEVAMDINRTFAIESFEYDRATVGPGETWRARAVVFSTDGFVPESCAAAQSGSRWFYARTIASRVFDGTDECVITSLGSSRYQVDIAKVMPQNLQPDLFSILFLMFTGQGQARYAMPGGSPQFIEAVNPSAAPRMKASNWFQKGLEPRATFFGTPIKNSFRVEPGKPFWIHLELKGDQEIKDIYFDVDLILNTPDGDLALAPLNFDISQDSSFVTAKEVISIFGKTSVRLQVTLPERLSGSVLYGFRLSKIGLETGDYSWTEVQMPDFPEGLFLTDGVPK